MINELDSPPYTIAPQVLSQFDARQTVLSRRLWDKESPFYGKDIHENAINGIATGEPGYSRVDYAQARAAWTVSTHFRGAYSWEELGEPDLVAAQMGRHPVDSPALMSQQVKEVAQVYGASLVGICRLNRLWLKSRDRDGRSVEVPPEYEYAVVMAIAMDVAAIKTSPAFSAAAAVGVGYSRMAFCIASLAEFIRHLGYNAIPMGNDTALSIPLAIDAGLGELGRNGLLVTPEYGPCVRLCKVFTDLPVEPDRPVEFGVADACRRCKRCAEACESGAISSEMEPSFEVACSSNNPGVLRWAVNHDKCYAFWLENGNDCATCIAVCPFA